MALKNQFLKNKGSNNLNDNSRSNPKNNPKNDNLEAGLDQSSSNFQAIDTATDKAFTFKNEAKPNFLTRAWRFVAQFTFFGNPSAELILNKTKKPAFKIYGIFCLPKYPLIQSGRFLTSLLFSWLLASSFTLGVVAGAVESNLDKMYPTFSISQKIESSQREDKNIFDEIKDLRNNLEQKTRNLSIKNIRRHGIKIILKELVTGKSMFGLGFRMVLFFLLISLVYFILSKMLFQLEEKASLKYSSFSKIIYGIMSDNEVIDRLNKSYELGLLNQQQTKALKSLYKCLREDSYQALKPEDQKVIQQIIMIPMNTGIDLAVN